NFSVTQSVYNANYQDKRFVPSLVQQELVEGGLLGRKSGQGFYDYRDGAEKPVIAEYHKTDAVNSGSVTLLGSGRVAELLASRLQQADIAFEHETSAVETGLQFDGISLYLTDGRPATLRGANVVIFDLPVADTEGAVLAYAVSTQAENGVVEKAQHCLQTLGFNAQQIADVPGLVVARTIAMLINEAADAVHQGVCDQAGADAAMKMGVNYPAGPFEWLAQWSVSEVVILLDSLDDWYRGERYRVSPWLRLKAYAEA
ncbi:MAG: 3-hydroxyacyl-CoA dehydrogenase family protein, partial [Thiolinea sp.]